MGAVKTRRIDMNRYTTIFFSKCPANNLRIKYELVIETHSTIFVEELLSFLSSFVVAYHENIADKLIEQFGGKQTLKAWHHGVLIETQRGMK